MTTTYEEHPARAMSPGDDVQRRTGVPLGGAGSLRTMLQQSLGARSFAACWQHWSPVRGHGLGRFVYAHLPVGSSRRRSPSW